MAFDYSSLFGKGGGGGGMDYGAMASKAGETSNQIHDSLMSPYRKRRARILKTAPWGLHIGEGIQPVASSPGGSAMVGAMREERSLGSDLVGVDQTSILDSKIRDANAKADTAHAGAAIVRRVAEIIAGGYMGGAGAGAGGGFSYGAAAKAAGQEYLSGLGGGDDAGGSASPSAASLARMGSGYSVGDDIPGYRRFMSGRAY